MKLWLLRPREDLPDRDNPWEPWYDKAFGFVVRADTEAEARALANTDAGDETSQHLDRERNDAWLSDRYSTCIELTSDGEAEIIIRDYASA